jgi:hypothetical protein
MLPFDIETVRPTSKATIRGDSGCRFEATLDEPDAQFLRAMPIRPDGLFLDGFEPRAVIDGLSPAPLYRGACGDISWGERAGWVSFEDFSRIRRIVYTKADEAGCEDWVRAAGWPWHRRCPQVRANESSRP